MPRFSTYVHTPDGDLAFAGNVNAKNTRQAIRSAPMLRPNHPYPIVAHALPKSRTRIRFRACVATLLPPSDASP